MSIHNRLVRAVVIVSVTCLSFVTSSCSVLFASGPPAGHERMTYFRCSESYSMPIWDIIFGLVGAAAVLPAFAFAGSAVVGFSKVSKCHAARADFEAAIEKTYSTPEGMRPDVTMDVVGVTLEGSDTIHVDGSTRAHAVAFNKSGGAMRARIFQWTSSDPAVAVVDTAGIVRARGVGKAVIAAVTGGVTGVRAVLVVP